jgi:hypothetical protein
VITKSEGAPAKRIRFPLPSPNHSSAAEGSSHTGNNPPPISPLPLDSADVISPYTIPSTGVYDPLPDSAIGHDPSTSNLDGMVPSNQSPTMDDSMNLLLTQMGTKVTRQYTMIPRSAAFQAYAAMQGITTKVLTKHKCLMLRQWPHKILLMMIRTYIVMITIHAYTQ